MRYRFALLALGLLAAAQTTEVVYPNRWVYVSRGLQNDSQVAEIAEILRTASAHGLNGMVLSAGLDRLSRQPAAYFRRLEEVRRIAGDQSIEIVPTIFSAGYGGTLTGFNPNLAEGLPVRKALFVARNGEARLAADPEVSFVNGGFEQYDGHRARGYGFHDRPGEVSFIDTEVFHSGAASLRFENFGGFPNGNGRVMQEIAVAPYRSYRVTLMVRTDGLEPAGAFRVQALTTSGRALAPFDPEVPATSGWRRVTLGFNSSGNDRIRIYAGVWGGRGGRFWVDDFAIEEAGFVNLLRRPGTPLEVESEATGQRFEEGADFEPVADRQLNFRFDHDGPVLKLTPQSRIHEGERLRVSFFHGISINRGQVTVCMSEPQVYEIWEREARRLHDTLGARRYLLSMDEIRMGGTCEACRRRGLTMAEILGECIRRQHAILRAVNPEAEILVWSDMLDPHHNARMDYYLVKGDYTGSWRHVPEDLVIMCWYHAKRRESLAHFSSLGFRTSAAAYYDADTLDNPRDWLAALRDTPGAVGIMYTTWENRYGLLADFGDLVSGR